MAKPPDTRRTPALATPGPDHNDRHPHDQVNGDGTRSATVTMGRHAWATCAIRSMDRGRCGRCCWCNHACDCPDSAWAVVA
jgi:hypothetical protein